ncbi:endolytic transglycosylase MltG [Patescibacteria group bacterium]|nr:endolytic transglycosylase MltG [Patescibacteria group bacterium]MBU1907587.1 endolytic transglycosylase MltG [Patescibacteria group bacterium]
MKRLGIILGLIIVLTAAAALFFVPETWLRLPLPDAPRVRIEISEGSNVSQVASLLQDKGLISSAFKYRIFAHWDELAKKPRAGEYDISVGTSYQQIARILATGPERNEISITIIEGWTIYDIQKKLEDLGVDVVPSDFLAERFADEFDFLKDLPEGASLEGYLFPDTYRVWKDQLPDGLLRRQLLEFMSKTSGFGQEASKQGRSLSDVVTLASIIEKEARHDEDRPIVAGVFMNRLNIGMAMQSDATLNYVIMSGRDRLTSADLEHDSPYNSYRNKGLPPGPIANPGMASLEAALNPAKTDFWYFLTDSSGKTLFAKTLEEHSRNRYKAFGE